MITVSIVSHCQQALVGRLLADLARLSPPGLRRVVLTLNVPEDAPSGLERLGCDVVILRNERPLGFGANHNVAFRHCDTPWFAVLNPDLRLQTDPFVPLLSAAAEKDALLAPTIIEADGRTADAARRVPTPIGVLRRKLGWKDCSPAVDFDWLAGMFLLVRSEAFRMVRGFDAAYFMYCEDTDLCLRLQLAGWNIRRVSAASVMHDAQRASHRSSAHFRWHVASLLRLWRSAVLPQYLSHRTTILLRRTHPSATTAAAACERTPPRG